MHPDRPRLFEALPVACVALYLAAGARAGEPAPQPLTFVENLGQWDTPARFVARQGALLARAEPGALVLELRAGAPDSPHGVVARLEFEGAREEAELQGRAPLPGARSYFGPDRERWRSGVRGYGQVLYRELYEGVDLLLRDGGGRLEYDLLLAPGADVGGVSVACEGVLGLALDSDGALLLSTELGTLTQLPPKTWCEGASGERVPVECRFVLLGERRYGFELGQHDAALPVVIDPGLEWASFLGGSSQDRVSVWDCVQVADDGGVFVAGVTSSTNFPTTPGAWDPQHNGQKDVFVGKLAGDGSTLVWSTFLGGSQDEEPGALLLEPGGRVGVVGWTFSSDFPGAGGALAGENDGFVSWLSADGASLEGTSRIGGSSFDGVIAAAAHGAGLVTVACYTLSGDLPTMGQGGPAYDPSYNGGADVYVARLDTSQPAGSQLLWATYLGGGGDDYPKRLALDASGEVLVCGDTASPDYPTTPGAFQVGHQGGPRDAFLSRLSADGTTLTWSTFLGGSGDESGNAMDLDPASGCVAVAGWTHSPDFPVTPGPHDTSWNGSDDVFVGCLDPTLVGTQQLVWASFFGGSGSEGANALAFDPAGGIVLTGATASANLPTTPGAHDAILGGSYDAFLARFSSGQLTAATYLGGAGVDYGYSLAAPAPEVAVVAGPTWSHDFPATTGAHDPSYNGNGDAFVARLDLAATVLAYCFGDGSGSPCPCGNPGAAGEGCANSTGAGARLATSGSTSVSADELGFLASGLLPGQPGLLFQGNQATNGGAGLLFGDGLRCAGQGVTRLGVRVPNAAGAAVWGPGLAGPGGWTAGSTRYFQVWYRDPSGSPCGSLFNLSHGLEVRFGV